MTPELVNLVCEIMKSLAILLEALAGAGCWSIRRPLDGATYGHVREGLHEVRRMVNTVTEHLKTNSGGSGASGSQGPLPGPPTQGTMAMAAPGPMVPGPMAGYGIPAAAAAAMPMVPGPMAMAGHGIPAAVARAAAAMPMVPGPPVIVFMTKSNKDNKGGKYHLFEECHGLRNAVSEVNDYDLAALLMVPRHNFDLCLVCKNAM